MSEKFHLKLSFSMLFMAVAWAVSLVEPSGAFAALETIQLKSGFNFVAFTSQPSATPAEMRAQNGMIDEIYSYSAAAGSFLSVSEGTLKNFAPGKGYVIKAKEQAQVSFNSFALGQIGDLSCKTGFNLPGFSKAGETVKFSELMTRYPVIAGMYKWINASGSFIQVVRDAGGRPVAVDGVDVTVKAGEAYFMNFSQNASLNIDGATIVVKTAAPVKTLSAISISKSTDEVAAGAAYDLSAVKAVASYSDATTAEVTTAGSWQLSSSGGSLSGTTFTAPSTAGTATLRFSYAEGSVTLTADLTLAIKSRPEASIALAAGPVTLNTKDRGLFVTPVISGQSVYVAYQLAPADSMNNKSLYYQKLDRNLNQLTPETIGIDVSTDTAFGGNLGDYKLAFSNGRLFMATLSNASPLTALCELDMAFKRIAGPVFAGNAATDKPQDMAFACDGNYLYLQNLYAPAGSQPTSWQTSVYKYTTGLSFAASAQVKPESRSVCTGNAMVFVPGGAMGAAKDTIQAFSTNNDFAAPLVNIQTYSIDPAGLTLNAGSTRVIVSDSKTYFPVGACFNTTYDIWVVCYEKEIAPGTLITGEDLGIGYVSVYDRDWNALQTLTVNGGSPAMRLMAATEGSDLYVAYDEMNGSGTSAASRARIELYKISAQ